MRTFIYWLFHIHNEHIKRGKAIAKCWACGFYYSLLCLIFILIPWKLYNKSMNEISQYVLIVIAISIPAVIVALIEYYSKKEKTKAETEEIKLKNEITKI